MTTTETITSNGSTATTATVDVLAGLR